MEHKSNYVLCEAFLIHNIDYKVYFARKYNISERLVPSSLDWGDLDLWQIESFVNPSKSVFCV